MNYIDFDESRKFDLILLGRIGIDFNPAYSDDVKEDFKPLKKVHYFEKFVGGSPANIAVGITHHGMKAGFIHVPFLPEQVVDKPANTPSMPLETIAQAIQIMVETIAKEA